MRDFDWNLIKSFLAVIEHETLLRAATHLQLSQPTLGRHITELEQATGLTLFDRGRNGMRATDAALLLADQARQVKMEANAFSAKVTSQNEMPRGTVRISASQIVANFVLPGIITALRKAEPDIEIELVSSNKLQNLLARDADIAIRMTRPVQNDIIARKAADFAMGAYAHKNYLADTAPIQKPEDLETHTLLGYDRDDLIIKGMARAGIKMSRNDFAIRTDDQVAYWHILCSGAGIGFAPQYMANQNSDLVQLFTHMEIESLPMWLATHREVATNLAIRRTMDFLASALRQLPLNPPCAH